MTKVHIDFETRSTVDIKKHGADLYARHSSTEVMCLAYAVGDEEVRLITEQELTDNDTLRHLLDLVGDEAVTFSAYNAAFERVIWEQVLCQRLGFPALPIRRWECTAAKAAAFALPRRLKDAALALEAEHLKDEEGHRVMLKLSQPRRPSKTNPDKFWYPHTNPRDFEILYNYCIDDVKTERAIDRLLRPLRPLEQEVWYLDQEINERGLTVDTEAIQKMLKLLGEIEDELVAEFISITNGEVSSPNKVASTLDWLRETQGLDLPNLQKATVEEALASPDISQTAARALKLRQQLSKASVKKYSKMLDRADKYGRVRGELRYHGASTGRWTGNGVQVQNIKRPELDGAQCLDTLLTHNTEDFRFIYPNVAQAASSSVRASICARDGYEFVAADYASIEARVIAWLCGQEDKLDLFRRGEDIYCDTASSIYGYKCNKATHPQERQVGKVSELALGYQGGIQAYAQMAVGYGLDMGEVYNVLGPTITDEEREKFEYVFKNYVGRHGEDALTRDEALAADVIKQRWRLANPAISSYWNDIQDAAIQAVKTGVPVEHRGVTYALVEPDFLACRLPSGRCLHYHRPRVKSSETPWGQVKDTLYHMDFTTTSQQYIRIGTYGGRLTENIVQAIARDVLAEAMLRVEKAGYPIVFTVHDELICEVEKGFGSVAEFEELMAQPPAWADGLPIAVEGWSGRRYRK